MGRRGAWGSAGVLAALLAALPSLASAQRARATVAVQSLVLRSNDTVRQVVRTQRVAGATVRARGDWCKGYPRLSVRIDGHGWHTLRLTRQWRDYDVPVQLKGGRHVVHLRFANDRTVRGRCSRSVRISEVRLNPGAQRRVPLGAALSWPSAKADSAYAAAAVREFDSFTPENEMKMSVVWRSPEHFEFAAADAMVDFARANGKEIHGHALVFDKQTPAWLARYPSAEQVAAAMRKYIHTTIGRYKDRVREWDVVNEAFDGAGRYRDSFWHQRLGSGFVELAFQYAREADPTARLYYNEYAAERRGPQRDAVYDLVRRLKERGLVDGVGLQMHTALYEEPSQAELEQTLGMYEALGLDVQITEMDVLARRDGNPASLADRLATQAGVYGAAARACEAVVACKRFTVWGVGDRFSWRGAEELPLLLDADLRPKPALATVKDALGH